MRWASEAIRNSLAVAVEAEGPAGLDQFEPRLGVAEEQHLGRAVGAAVDDVQSIGADPLDAHDLDDRGPARPRESFAPATTLSKASMNVLFLRHTG